MLKAEAVTMRRILTILKNILIIAGLIYGLYTAGRFENNQITFFKAMQRLLYTYLIVGSGYAMNFIKKIIK